MRRPQILLTALAAAAAAPAAPSTPVAAAATSAALATAGLVASATRPAPAAAQTPATAAEAPTAAPVPSRASAEDRALALEILRDLIEIDSSEPDGDKRAAAEAMAARLRDAGFPAEDVEVVGPEPRLGNVVARYRGSDPELGPVLVMAHLDVVPALASDWSLPPFELTEGDGYLYGRGVDDNKAGGAILVTNFIRYRRDGVRPERDIVMVLTADEETTGASIAWLVEIHPLVRRAALALNTDAGGGDLVDGRHRVMHIQASEKVYQSYTLEATNPGGHSSLPRPDNAIYQLTRALNRLAEHRFPVQLNEVTRGYYRRTAELGGPDAADRLALVGDDAAATAAAAERLSADPSHNSRLRTTCVATMLEAGHAENALPQTARAVVNCRILPGEDIDAVDRTLRRVIADDAITLARIDDPIPSPPSPLTPGVMDVIERLTEAHFPGAVVVPGMSAGATDGLFVRNGGIPVYGTAGLFAEPGDVRAHGRDERILRRSFEESLDFWYDLMRARFVTPDPERR